MIPTMFRRSLGATLAAMLACNDAPAPINETLTGTDSASAATTSTTTGTTATDTATSPTDATSTSTTTSSTSSTAETGTTGADGLPPTPVLLSPLDGSLDEPVALELCWEPVVDPDGDAVRYRVFIDDIDLTGGLLDDKDGYDGPCVGPLNFDFDRTYTWRVQAFEVDEPSRSSESSAPWAFTVEGEAGAHVVFLDRFDEDLGWSVGGDAVSGAWVRGNPIGTFDGEQRAQPARCDGGQACYFTAQNPAGVLADQDVAGGSTTLTSPPFDLAGAAAATVELRRSFYRSDPSDASELTVELLTPDDAEPGGYAVQLLERLDQPTAAVADNLWIAREYAACAIPLLDGSRVRVTATDPGVGILEAAIDTVRVRAHDTATVCGSGEGGQCDPSQGDAACPDALLCCPRTAVQAGVFRCSPAVPGLDAANPPADPEAPNNGPLGCNAPDLVIDPSWIDPMTNDIMVGRNTCELLEGCVDDVGIRTILRFSLSARNIGSTDLVLGVAANNPDVFHYSGCHDHYHFDNFANYELRDGETVIARGHKQAFCLLDSYSPAWPNAFGKFYCGNQGISRGFADIYEAELPCQWIDITEVPPGDYTLRAEINPVQEGAATALAL